MDRRTERLRERTKQFALRIIRLFQSLPASAEAQVIGSQLLRCGPQIGAKYRVACHSRSRATFVARMGVIAEEADESVFWIELLSDLGIIEKDRIDLLLQEASELAAIFKASRKTAKRR